MEILIVNGYSDSPNGNATFEKFSNLVTKSVASCTTGRISGKINTVVRRMYELHEYTCDWEHDVLNEESRYNTNLFDKLDLIFITGDMGILPWDTLATQLITLINMANHANKPLFSVGIGAYAVVYAINSGGRKYHFWNGPVGDVIEHLPRFDHYSSSYSSDEYPGGWLDNETGDVYVYHAKSTAWIPTCNIGMFRSASTGIPSSTRLRKPAKVYQRVVDSTEIVEGNEVVININSKMLQSVSVKNFPSSTFIASILPDWCINSSLPATADSFKIVAEASNGSASILQHQNKLLIALDFCGRKSMAVIERMLTNYLITLLNMLCDQPYRIDSSINAYLFGKDGHPPTYGLYAEVKKAANPLGTKSIISSLQPHGPREVKVPNKKTQFAQFSYMTVKVDNIALTSPRLNTTLGKKVPVATRDPSMSRSKRLNSYFIRTNCDVDHMKRLISVNINVSDAKDKTQRSDNSSSSFGNNWLDPNPQYIPSSYRPQTTTSYSKNNNSNNGTSNVRRHSSSSTSSSTSVSTAVNITATAPNSSNSKATSSSAYFPTFHPVPHALMSTADKSVRSNNNIDSVVRVDTAGTTDKPFNNSRKYDGMILNEEKNVGPFVGTYTEVYRSEHEKHLYEESQNRKQFISNQPFQRHFGVRSSIPLREEGLIRPQGAYPKVPSAPHQINGTTATDWNLIRSIDKSKHLSTSAWT